ncbi:MAG: hypothetical protein QG639_176 [Patescibacteria group bacterium]|nr:hypothetical protein [Patescibacteria group bacterium]
MSTLFSARVILLLLAVATLNVFFFRSWDGLGTALLITLLYGLITFTHWKDLLHQPAKKWFILNSLGILLGAVVVMVRANDVVQFIAVLTSELLLLTLWNSFQARQPGVHSFAELVMTPFVALRNHGVGIFRFALQSRSASKPATSPLSSSKIKSILIGILVSIPLIAIVGGLLAAGDPIFQATLKDIFDIQLNIDERIGQRILLTLLFTVLLIPFVQRKLGVPFTSPLKVLSKYNLVTEYSVVVFLLTLLLGFFLFIQWKYIFVSVAAETDLSQFGVATYSEYVTRGFGELLFVSLIIYSVVWLGLVLIRNSPKLASSQKLKMLQLVLLSEFGIFLLSLFRRVWLYQSLHGMTVVRVYGSYLLLLVCLFALTLAGRHLIQKSIRWVQIEMGILVAAVFLLSVVNVEQQFVVKHPPTVNNRVDYVYLARLSPDGSEGWQQSLTYAQSILTNPELMTNNIINADQRREIALAGSVVKALQLQHYRLLRAYGSAQEINNFYLASLSQSDERYSQRINYYLELNGPESATAATLLKDREKVRALKSEIEHLADASPSSLDYNFYGMFYSGTTKCDYSYCFNSFFDWRDFQVDEVKVDSTEQLLKYNASAYSLYRQREAVLPLDTLLSLEDQYVTLQGKIQTQPENEREFTVDINYFSPLITDL